ncbi:slipin family protein [Actinosynnema pretiosum]|uniref:Band 7 domain-containing protein n=1 Tax=Actinosynnema pretiosum TaxID=42197 RepID=A0A290Z2A5_9PSEU|nr:slipin family protein [Actinosynnema pretiosum]ATE53166.1 hypothetical protein CNX65_07565 [Actinosynnema pretiosum]
MKVVVMPWHRAVRFRDGEHVGELGPGRRRVGRRDSLHRVDTRLQTSTPSSQEIPTADGVHVRVTPALTYAVVDASRCVLAADSPTQVLHLACQLRLRAAVAARAHDRVDPERAAIAAELHEGLRPLVDEIGVEVREVAIRDVVMPPELRRAAIAEITARAEGRAALERARGESAALRSLLNAARLAEEHPVLLQLRSPQNAQTVVVEQSGAPRRAERAKREAADQHAQPGDSPR